MFLINPFAFHWVHRYIIILAAFAATEHSLNIKRKVLSGSVLFWNGQMSGTPKVIVTSQRTADLMTKSLIELQRLNKPPRTKTAKQPPPTPPSSGVDTGPDGRRCLDKATQSPADLLIKNFNLLCEDCGSCKCIVQVTCWNSRLDTSTCHHDAFVSSQHAKKLAPAKSTERKQRMDDRKDQGNEKRASWKVACPAGKAMS